MDIFWLEAVVDELQGAVTDTRINKIHQPTADTLILKLWTGQATVRLLISLDSRYSRIHLTEQDYPNPFTPPRFCQLLRARLSALTDIRKRPGERIVELAFRGKDRDYRLIAELTGRHGNLILVDEDGRIVDALKRVSGGDEARSIRPGGEYVYPRHAERRNILQDSLTVPDSATSADAFREWLLAELTPMSRAQANRMAAEVERGELPQSVLERFRDVLAGHDYSPRIAGQDQGGRLELFPESDGEVSGERYVTISAALDAYYYALQFQSGRIGDGRELLVLVERELKKLRKRREHIAAEEQKKSHFDERRQLGDLLLANLHLVKKGMEQVEVTDYTCDPPEYITIPLDVRLSPQQNAEVLFKHYKKEKRGMGHVSRRLQETEDELTWFEGLALALDDAQSPEELAEVRHELVEAGFIKPQRTDHVHRRTQRKEPNLNRTVSPSGLIVLWGRNNRSNDEVSSRQTAKDDLWFHAHNQPGCHLVLKRGERQGDLPEEDIRFAASLAAGYSRGRHDHKVEVMVAEGKAVHRPRGAKPGLVTVGSYRTLVVAPKRLEENDQ